jgi:hypothetical protein
VATAPRGSDNPEPSRHLAPPGLVFKNGGPLFNTLHPSVVELVEQWGTDQWISEVRGDPVPYQAVPCGLHSNLTQSVACLCIPVCGRGK